MEELMDNVETTRRDHVEYLLDEAILPMIFGVTNQEGLDILKDQKATGFMIEAIRAALLAASEVSHPLHLLAGLMMDDDGDMINISNITGKVIVNPPVSEEEL